MQSRVDYLDKLGGGESQLYSNSLRLYCCSQLAWQRDGLKECVGFGQNVSFLNSVYHFPGLLAVSQALQEQIFTDTAILWHVSYRIAQLCK